MSGRDETNDNHASPETLSNVGRRNFLKYLAGAFATAALPETLVGCSAPATDGVERFSELVDLSSAPITWVTRKEDGLSLGFQFVNLVSDANHNIALGSSGQPAYVVVTFPPQHIIEEALTPVAPFDNTSRTVSSYASGTSRLVFSVPSSYGAAPDAGGISPLPYTLQGVLELCARSGTVVAAAAKTSSAAHAKPLTEAELDAVVRPAAEEMRHESLSQARIDRVIARVDPRAAARVHRRAARAARMQKRSVAVPTLHAAPLTTMGAAVAPASGESSIELPFRLLMSTNDVTRWAFVPAPVLSPAATGADALRTEMWHARPGLPDPVTGLADPSRGGLTLRALWTRDYDIYQPFQGATYNEPVPNANPTTSNRDAIVQNTASPTSNPLAVNRLMLTPLGGTIDLSAQFPAAASTSGLVGWTQKTVLGRDEYVETVNAGTLLPFGHPCALVSVNKRAEDPTQGGTVGVLYQQTYLVVGEPLVSFHDLPNAADYRTFPFVAVELTLTKILCSAYNGNQRLGDVGGMVMDPTGATLVQVGATGTDQKGRAVHFSTPVYFSPQSQTAAAAMSNWNAQSPAANGTPCAMNRQRVALAPPADGHGASPTSYAPDGTSFETVSFNITLASPSLTNPQTPSLVPVAKNITLAVEAFRHLQQTQNKAPPNADGIYNYDTVTYAPNGFDPTANPHEVFLTEAFPGSGPALDLTPSGGSGANSGGLAAPGMAANALTRAAGPVGGTTGPGAPMMKGSFDPNDYFGGKSQSGAPNGFLDSITLFGFLKLKWILDLIGGGGSSFMPKSVTQDISKAEEFLEKAVQIYGLLAHFIGDDSGSAGQISQILDQVTSDINAYAQLAQGIVPQGTTGATPGLSSNPGAPLTNAQMQEAAWMQSAATQAQYLIQGYFDQLKTIYEDGKAVYGDITALNFENLVSLDGSGDLQKFLTALDGLVKSVKGLADGIDGTSKNAGPESAFGTVISYFGPVANAIDGALKEVSDVLGNVDGVLQQIITDLALLAQGIDMVRNQCVEFKWKPKICGVEVLDAVAFVPSTDRAFMLDVKVNANSNKGAVGLSLTCRMDSFAIAFGQGISGATPFGTMPPGYSQIVKNADISLVFDHIQVQMLAGHKPDIDCVFKDIFFGGDLAFIETIKDLIPLDAFSDPPFIKVTVDGITAGFTFPIPNIAIGMFSIQNINIGASLTIPWLSTNVHNGITFHFDFCTIDNPFVVTVMMLGGGGFFGMTLDMSGLQRLQFGISVGAQLALDFVIASGSVSIEAGIFLVYTEPGAAGGKDPVTGQDMVDGWVIGGYLRLRGELDILGIITIAVELYIQIIYEATSGKCIASGFVKVDISLFFFSIHVKVSFTRKFAGSNGDPTFADMMAAGGVDPMVDPALLNSAPSAMWDPFAEYCMAYA